MQLLLKIKINLLLATILIAGLSAELAAQTFDEARKLSFGGERAKARNICKQILSEGFNSDVALLMGRTYAWDGMYDSARVVFNEVLVQKPGNMEAYDALSDVEYWSENYERAIEYCDAAIQNDPTDESFVLKKARILYSSEDYENAVNILEDYLHQNPGQEEFIRKLRDYRLDLMKNKIKINYTVDFFEEDYNRDPWQITALTYSRKTKLGSVIARANYANRFGNKGFQYEIDAYPKFTENSYVYLNYGFSNNSLFPKNRYGMEWYQNLPKAFEASLGMRLLQFSDSYVDIYTATIGKYAGNYWLSLRSYVTPDTTGTSVSGSFQVRRYFSDPENYLGFKMGYGVSPDENRDIIDSADRLNLKKGSVRLDYNHIINHRFIFNVGAEWGTEETRPGTMSSYYTFDASVAWLF
jgi:YaiO family outer membrane protein